jgi:predicted regulator of Ras-like GTPase activity (Roadblock/LC7/MglB family)
MDMMEAALATLRDVEGVLGSFVIDADGGVAARDMPAMVDDVALAGAGRRVVRLRAALESTGKKVEQCSLRFGSYLMLAKPAEAHTLCVLVSSTSNLMALQMGSTLVARRVNAESLARLTRPSQLPAPAPHLPVPSQLLPPAPSMPLRSTPSAPLPTRQLSQVSEPQEELDAPSPTRFFRGRPV